MPGPKLSSIFVALSACLLLAGFGPGVSTAAAAPTGMVNLGTASTYGAFSGASVANTISAVPPHTKIRGDLGVKVNAPPAGFPPGIVTGQTNVGNSAAIQAHADLLAAYNEVEGRTGAVEIPLTMAGQTLVPGLYKVPGAASNTGTLTLDALGDPNAVFVIQVTGALAFATSSHVVLTGGAKPSRVFWQVNGAAGVGPNGDIAGTVMALNAVAMSNQVLVNGRLFAVNGALTLDANQIYSAPPVVTITGGASATTNNSTPTISGTTDLEAPGEVSVTVNGQTLTATPSGGAWSVTSASLSNGTYPVVASVTDAAGNQSSFTQQLTVDTVLPVVSIDGGPSLTTNDPTPTISGTSDVEAGTIVEVAVGSQTLSAVVNSEGSWNVAPAALPEGTYTITASVSDPAGNSGTDSQELTVDTAGPAVSITGGASALTNDATPTISGTSDVPVGDVVTVSIGAQTLSGVVQNDGTWTVTAAGLSDGPHHATAEATDTAGNTGSSTQTLTVDTVAPIVSITGGTTANTTDRSPTISGTTDLEAPGQVSVTVNGQTLTATPSGGAWSVTSADLADATYPVVASVTDAAGNPRSFTQQLTVDTVAPVVSIDGGPFLITNDPDLTIFGTSDAPAGAIVEVSVDSQTPLTAVVQSDTSWNVTPFGLEEGIHTVTASVSDPAGNEGTDSQELTVDSSDPNVSITGGPSALTNDPTPVIAGFADVEPGNFVTVSIAGQTLSGEVQSDGTWTVTAAALSDGSHSVFAQVEDEAGNFGGDAQTLTVDTVAPAITITGGATAHNNDSTPAISGTAGAPTGTSVSVSISGQTLSGAVQPDGSWSVTAAALADGPYPVTAEVTDTGGNTGSASQTLTIDTAPPVITITGGGAAQTDDATPTIAGTSDVASGTIVEVSVDSQTLYAVVNSGGSWNVTAAVLPEGTHTVTASVSDPAGNEGTDSQELTVDGTAPAISITGGASALTNDPTPAISGTAGVPTGTIVTVLIAGQTLSGEVQPGGAWTATAATLSEGPHSTIAEVTDAAGNTGSVSQTLTVDTVAPVVSITGGAAAQTDDATPTISGASNAAPGTTVTVSIAGQTQTTLLQTNGTWNATPTQIGEGTWTVTASAPDPAGNVGSAQQTLVISPDGPPPVDPPAPPDPAPAAGEATVSGNASQRVRGSLSIRATVTASATRGVAVTASGPVKIRGTKKPVRLATSIIRVGAGQSGLLRLRAKGNRAAGARAVRQIKAAIADHHRVLAVIAIRLVDDGGNARLVTKRVRLRR